jgi:uncharacterized small protein (DUF1192 family)
VLLDDEPPRKKEGPQARNLEPLSIAELEDYIRWLEGEISRTHGEIKRKKAATAAADGFFKK